MKNFNVFGIQGKIRVLKWGFHEKPIYRRHCLEWGGGMGGRGAWTICRFKRGGAWQEKGEGGG